MARPFVIAALIWFWPLAASAYDLEAMTSQCRNHDGDALIRAAYCRVVAEYTDDPETRKKALIDEARAHAVAGLGGMADDDLSDLLDAHPDDRDVLRGWADSLAGRGFYSDARARYERLIELGAPAAPIRLTLAQYRMKQQNFAGAIDDLSEAVAADPSLAEAFAMRGEAYLRLEDLEAARQDLKAAIEIDNGNAAYHATLGDVLYAMGLSVEPLAIYRLALVLDPDNAAAMFGAGRLRFEMGEADADFEQARTHLTQAVSGLQDNAIASFMLSLTHARLGQAEEAEIAARAAFGSRPYLAGFFKVLLKDGGFQITDESPKQTDELWDGLRACAARQCKLWQ